MKYFTSCNLIDSFNQSRQYDLRLEKHWVMHGGLFRSATTLFVTIVVNCWREYIHHLPGAHRHKNIKTGAFTWILCLDLLGNTYLSLAKVEHALITVDDDGSTNVTPSMHDEMLTTVTFTVPRMSQESVISSLSLEGNPVRRQKENENERQDKQHLMVLCPVQ